MRGWAEAAGWKEPRDPLVQPSLGLSTVTAGRDSHLPEGGLPVPRLDPPGGGGTPPGASTIVCQLKEYPSWLKGSVVETRWGF